MIGILFDSLRTISSVPLGNRFVLGSMVTLKNTNSTCNFQQTDILTGLGKSSSFEELSSFWQGTLLLKVPQNRNLVPFDKELPHPCFIAHSKLSSNDKKQSAQVLVSSPSPPPQRVRRPPPPPSPPPRPWNALCFYHDRVARLPLYENTHSLWKNFDIFYVWKRFNLVERGIIATPGITALQRARRLKFHVCATKAKQCSLEILEGPLRKSSAK